MSYWKFIGLIIGGLLIAAPSPKPRVIASPIVRPVVRPIIDKIIHRSPLCECKECNCENCVCNTVDQTPELFPKNDDLKPTQIVPVSEPPVQVCPTLPKKAAAPAAAGHWETRQSCGRGGCTTMQVWVPHTTAAAKPVSYSQGSCSSGSCGVRRGLFGRRR